MIGHLAEPLGRSARRVLNFIVRYHNSHGWAPTVREISDGIQVQQSGVHRYLTSLVRQGFIRRGPRGTSRTISPCWSRVEEVK